jgi:NAD(P)-dependent dehydrogenase (short-subunit alcohol dehydrogenase family)
VKDFKDKVALITGAASGVGQALAEHGVRLRMKVVLADVEAEALAKTEAEMRSAGAPVLAVRTDVSQAKDVEALAQKTLETFGAVHLLCNNAGVATSGTVACKSPMRSCRQFARSDFRIDRTNVGSTQFSRNRHG